MSHGWRLFFCLVSRKAQRMYAGILPYAVHRGTVWFLLGKERAFPDFPGSNLWAPFGGGVEQGESLEDAALREGYEETMGIFGTPAKLGAKVDPAPWYHRGGMTRLLRVRYDPKLPQYFRRFYRYSTHCRKSCEGWYEKTAVRWFRLEDLLHPSRLALRPEFRKTLRSLQRHLMAHHSQIHRH